ncbi:MurR/RpiR family transcriptional regulator [Clostridium sp. AM58-1XD]|uniref:MurR/RpiR family transcriptional regulator n=1 Tax=Clostridium sp. AM58-1XD TaxID=2292307 RepID=UPI000E49CD3A|nr:MurR/RpiR family transcriptional regulator [Clostridium sp. AM58-1XD]RGY99216.1 MurR/RpiR family transcriptional regulator [Clostridium sp. AM58-1XD]
MEKYEKTIIPFIESIYSNFTSLEKTIADFFINNKEAVDFSSKNISRLLFVSEASLSRFAKKCGFAGYREFIFRYQEDFEKAPSLPVSDDSTRQVLDTYQELLNKSYSLVDEQQIARIVGIFSTKKRVYIYGRGSSGFVGMEMKLRFMRLGVNVEAITDSHIMKMNSVLLNEDCAVIGISVSGQTEEVMVSLRDAYKQGAFTILITSQKNTSYQEFCDEVLLCAVKEYLNYGKAISPQFPLLVMADILYAHFLRSDQLRKEALHQYTLGVLSLPKNSIDSVKKGD